MLNIFWCEIERDFQMSHDKSLLQQVALTAAFLVIALPIGPALAQNQAVTVTVDAAADQHSISPNIYGVAFAADAALDQLNVPLHRHGGNATSRYNWQLGASNRAHDWYFQSIGDSDSTPGGSGDDFISRSFAAGAEPMLTIPMQDWVARLGPNREKLASFSIAKYGAQTDNDWQWFPDAGNGIRTNGGGNITDNDENDAHVPASSVFQRGWVQHLIQTWGSAAGGGLNYYILDNEPTIWWGTHRDVHRTGKTMDELRDLILEYGQMIKTEDPDALVVAPEVWGWSSYIYSGYDQQWGSLNGWGSLPDRNAHGGWDHLPWLLDQLRQADQASGQRILDVFTVHYYPQGGEFSNDTSSQMQLRRNRSTRALWDPTYVDEAWINTQVRLIPRLHEWVDTYYPGTEIGLTEYNWGAEGHINGATTLADILGIFGREDLDFGNYWTTPGNTTPTFKAIQMYRNYDGAKNTFGDVNAQAVAANPDNLSAFAATRSTDGALTVMLVGKVLSGDTPVTVDLANFDHLGVAEVWQLTAANTINQLADLSISGNSLSLNVPAQSITLLVIPGLGDGNLPPIADIVATPTTGFRPLDVTFDGSGSSDPEGAIVSYQWDFMDGGTASGAVVNHIYAIAGVYGARLTVTDDQGANGTTTVMITAKSDTPIDDLAQADLPVAGSVTGDFNRTHSDDAVRQQIRERESGGKPTNRYSWLDNRWRFEVAGGAGVTFNLNAHAEPSSDGDAFDFEWSSDNNSFAPMLTVTKTSDDGAYQTFVLPSTTRGTVYIRVRDTDQTRGNRDLDSVFVDHMFFRSEVIPGDPPAAPTGLIVADVGDGRIDIAWQDNATDELGYDVERSEDGTAWSLLESLGADTEAYSDDGLPADTAFWYRARAFNGSGQSSYAGPVQATTPPAPTPVLNLTVLSTKDRGKHAPQLNWSGASTTNVDIYRDGAGIATVPDNPPYTDNIGTKGSAVYLYQVCEEGSTTACSNTAQASY
jgi:hypothetical protein